MFSSSVPKPWLVADVTFVEIEIRHPSERQMRVEFGCGVRLVITDESQFVLSASLIETIRFPMVEGCDRLMGDHGSLVKVALLWVVCVGSVSGIHLTKCVFNDKD
jgi:hypothetical protein